MAAFAFVGFVPVLRRLRIGRTGGTVRAEAVPGRANRRFTWPPATCAR